MGKAIVISDVDFSDFNLGVVHTAGDLVWEKSVDTRDSADANGWFNEAGGLDFLGNPNQPWIMWIAIIGSTYQKPQNLFGVFNTSSYDGVWVSIIDQDISVVRVGYPRAAEGTRILYSEYSGNIIKIAIKFDGSSYYLTKDGTTWVKLGDLNVTLNGGVIGKGSGTSQADLGGVSYKLFNTTDIDIAYLWD